MTWEQRAARSIRFFAGIEVGDGNETGHRNGNGTNHVRKMIEKYSTEVCEPPTLDSLAVEFETSERSLRRHFHDSLGLSVKAYLAQLRATRIIVALALRPELSLDQIAHTQGYSQGTNIRVALVHQFGIRPTDVREGPIGIFCAIDSHRDWVEGWWGEQAVESV